jgi:hypothetical protein
MIIGFVSPSLPSLLPLVLLSYPTHYPLSGR